jgi:hypothetical protein
LRIIAACPTSAAAILSTDAESFVLLMVVRADLTNRRREKDARFKLEPHNRHVLFKRADPMLYFLDRVHDSLFQQLQ